MGRLPDDGDADSRVCVRACVCLLVSRGVMGMTAQPSLPFVAAPAPAPQDVLVLFLSQRLWSSSAGFALAMSTRLAKLTALSSAWHAAVAWPALRPGLVATATTGTHYPRSHHLFHTTRHHSAWQDMTMHSYATSALPPMRHPGQQRSVPALAPRGVAPLLAMTGAAEPMSVAGGSTEEAPLP